MEVQEKTGHMITSLPFADGNCHAGTNQSTFDVPRHVVWAFVAVPVEVFALGTGFGGDTIEGVAHVGTDILVPVLIEAEGAAGVLDEEVQQADLVVADGGQLVEDDIRYEVRATRPGRQGEVFLVPRHGDGGVHETKAGQRRL